MSEVSLGKIIGSLDGIKESEISDERSYTRVTRAIMAAIDEIKGNLKAAANSKDAKLQVDLIWHARSRFEGNSGDLLALLEESEARRVDANSTYESIKDEIPEKYRLQVEELLKPLPIDSAIDIYSELASIKGIEGIASVIKKLDSLRRNIKRRENLYFNLREIVESYWKKNTTMYI
jgi:hypothetical protein